MNFEKNRERQKRRNIGLYVDRVVPKRGSWQRIESINFHRFERLATNSTCMLIYNHCFHRSSQRKTRLYTRTHIYNIYKYIFVKATQVNCFD